MDIKELIELNKLHKKSLLYSKCALFAFLGIIGTIFYVAFTEAKPALFFLVFFVFLLFFSLVRYFKYFTESKKILFAYVGAQFPDWKKGPTDRVNNESIKEILLSFVLPEYRYENRLSWNDEYSFDTETLKKSITQMTYEEIKTREYRDSKNRRREETYISQTFRSGVIFVETQKNINGITCFKTNNYPDNIPKKIREEKPYSDLPKVESPNAEEYHIDIYSNNQETAKALAVNELFAVMQKLKEYFGLYYVKVVFAHNYIIFILRHDKVYSLGTFFANIPFRGSIRVDFVENITDNFKILTDLANKAADFTKNL